MMVSLTIPSHLLIPSERKKRKKKKKKKKKEGKDTQYNIFLNVNA